MSPHFWSDFRAPFIKRGLLCFCAWIPVFFVFSALSVSTHVLAQSGIQYRVNVEGIPDRRILDLVESVSETIQLKDRPPLSRGLLQRRIDQDSPRLMKVLRSQGYYGAEIQARTDFDVDPVLVIFDIHPGPPYILESVELEVAGLSADPDIGLPGVEELGLKTGEPARSKVIIDAGGVIIWALRARGFPFPKVEEPRVIVDHASKTVAVTYPIDPGPAGLFGPVEIKGLVSVDSDFVKRRIPWRRGDIFNANLLGQTEMEILKTGLFTMVRIEIAERLDEQDQLPLVIQLRERRHRTLKTGLGYRTDEGPWGKTSWEHRNLFQHGEALNLSVLGSGIAYALEGSFKKPEFKRPDQALLANLRLADDHPDAFRSKNIMATLQITQDLKPGMKVATGVGLRYSEIEQFGRKESYHLFSTPVDFTWDRSDDLLNPSRGGRLAINLSPYLDFRGRDFGFIRVSGGYSHYFKLSSMPVSILAIRGGMGILTGAARDKIPADIRFYGGGGGSIRGYAYQSVGPLFHDGTAMGGRSMVSLSTEVRVMVTDKIGLVPFVDGGNVFENAFPDFKGSLQWGAGIGLRYFTPIGPMRFDVGVPLNKRQGIDNPFQLYISLGQAF